VLKKKDVSRGFQEESGQIFGRLITEKPACKFHGFMDMCICVGTSMRQKYLMYIIIIIIIIIGKTSLFEP
jgi:hypothetical protein